MPDTNINLKAKDDASLALQNATDRLKALRTEIDGLRGKGDLERVGCQKHQRHDARGRSFERGLGLVKPAADNAGTGITGLLNKL